MNRCQAPYRLPDNFYDDLESGVKSPEEFAVELMLVMTDDRKCGEPAVATVRHGKRVVHVCAWHEEQHRTLIAPLLDAN